MTLLAALQSAAQALPEDAPATAAQLAADAAPAAQDGINMLALILHASIPVQLVMVLLLLSTSMVCSLCFCASWPSATACCSGGTSMAR